MKTIKIKLSFAPETAKNERKAKLELWASTMLKGNQVNIIEENHMEKQSYIVVENTKAAAKGIR